MKTIGLLGGMSWQSTVPYYQIINQGVAARLAGLHSARLLLYSVDFSDIERCQANGDWDESARILGDAARQLALAGADFLVLCTNTMHKVADSIEQAAGIPLLHIADATAEEVKRQGITTIALLGTKYTMSEDFYLSRLEQSGLTVLVPDADAMTDINRVIFDELCQGMISATSRQRFVTVVNDLAHQGAQGVILGCTEIGLLLIQEDLSLPMFDTTEIHAERAVDIALQEDSYDIGRQHPK